MAYKLTPRYLEMLVNSSRALVKACLDLGLECRDPPIASTALLYSLGHTQYEVRSLWSRLSKRNSVKATIYKYEDSRFYAELSHEIETIYTLDYGGLSIPVDRLDAERLRRKHCTCNISPHSHTVRVYIKGNLSQHVSISVNAVRILVLLGEYLGYNVVDNLLDSLLRLVWRNELAGLKENIAVFFKQHKYASVLSIILPYVPRDEEDLLKVSPLLRRLTAHSRPRIL
ncbi:MAG: hypothetical protein GSR73_06105 [Desulfurococcales archaeon]|nr:hypothetical protein [Desulfurococcales archaeon]